MSENKGFQGFRKKNYRLKKKQLGKNFLQLKRSNDPEMI